MSKRISKTASFLYGKNSILERVKTSPQTIKEVFIRDGFDAVAIVNAVKKARIPLSVVSQRELSKMKRADNLQGIIAKIDSFKYVDFDDLLNSSQKTLIFLDHLYDPQNLGVIIRTAACFGNFAVIIPKHDACEVTDSVLHVACGGENYVPVSRITNLSQALRKAKDNGYWIVGGVVEDGEDITNTELPFPLGIVMGSEGKGIRQGLLKHIDKKVYIPMTGAALSLNVAMASLVFCYEAIRQGKNEKKGN
ncbi:MAG: 23S rRNA (guanosine(2251)-2'-O)-methyltransferase RlmB [Candidatus Omnitrophica bacterium]|nr:23S rRNA (guanosine(2251)-2'-O)-methyltransferase RlmB [Candidatus Omnitrophota bacterium]